MCLGIRCLSDIDLGEVSDYQCPGLGVFAHTRCDQYYTCYENTPTHLWKCKLNYFFDLRYNGCNYPQYTYCGNRTLPEDGMNAL